MNCCENEFVSRQGYHYEILRSIVGRLLEHSRVYFFNCNGQEKIFLSFVDMLTHNLNNRIKNQMKAILKLELVANVKARQQGVDDVYDYVVRKKRRTSYR